jgi:pimeloyl-ACP methyl ester carboxylesterase
LIASLYPMPYLLSSDIQTHYVVRGAGRPLVLLHGGLVNKQMWLPQLADLAADHCVIAYDLRDHGETVSLPRGGYALGLLVADLRELLRRLRVARPILCGLSLGGAVALSYAACFPEDVAALVLCGTAASTTHTPLDRALTGTVGATLPLSVRAMGVATFVDYALWMAARLRGERWLGRTAAVRAYLRASMRGMGAAEMARVYRLILSLRTPDLAAVRAPALLLNGAHEDRSVVRQSAFLQRRLAHAERCTIADAGHLANLDQPAAFSREVRRFLANRDLTTIPHVTGQPPE